MAVKQSSIEEIRYIKRQNLEQEAKLLGNMYRDQIRSYGIDCLYYKLDKSLMHTYKNVVDDNNVLFHAYGYDHNPEYSLSTHMIVYMEVQNDVFNLNKYGLIPNMDVTFVFDRLDFACAVAPKFGQYEEHQISSIQFSYDINQLSSAVFSQNILQDIGFTTLSANVSVELNDISPGVHEEYCNVVGKGFAKTVFPVNNDIYKSFMRKILNEDDIIVCIKAIYEVNKDTDGIINGRLDGSFLFYNVESLFKYYELLHPDVGDIVTIDFPDSGSREQYEITEAVDKSFVTDGINALLHKYIWRCKARRYINSYEQMEHNEANQRLDEINKYDAAVKEEITKDISRYIKNEDDVYGGYENNNTVYDKQTIQTLTSDVQYTPDGMLECIMQFQSGSSLATDGYELWFIRKDKTANVLAINEIADKQLKPLTKKPLQWLKANDDNIVFNTLDGKSYMLALDTLATPKECQICLDSLFDLTIDSQPIKSQNGNNFYLFKSTRTLLYATENSLFCHLANKTTYKLA